VALATRWSLLALCVIGLLGAYLGNRRLISAGDSHGNRLTAMALVSGHGLQLERLTPPPDPDHYSVVRRGEHLYASFPVGTGLLAAPVFWRFAPGDGVWTDAVGDFVEELAAALLAALTALVVFALARRLWPLPTAAALTLLFALATSQFAVASQSLWPATGAGFFVALALLTLVAGAGRHRAAVLGGLAMGAAFLCRATTPVLIGPLALWFVRRRSRAWVTFLAASVLAVGAAAWLQSRIWGSWLGGYASLNPAGSLAPGNLPAGLLGTLLSPSRGLLPWMPWLLAAPWGLRLARGPEERRLWWVAALAAGVGVLTIGSYWRWWGGYSLGPRLQTEMNLFLVLLVAPVVARWRELTLRARLAFAAAALLTAYLQGAAIYRAAPWHWNEVMRLDQEPTARWSIANSQWLVTAIPGWEPRIATYRVEATDPSLLPEAVAIDLSGAANARYDGNPFSPRIAEAQRIDLYPRLVAEELDKNGLFRFLPRRRNNVLTVCGGDEPAQIPLPGGRYEALQVVLAAGRTRGLHDGDEAGGILVEQGGREHWIPLVLGRDLFDHRLNVRRAQPPPASVLAGLPDQPDVLVCRRYRLPQGMTSPDALRLVVPAAGLEDGPCLVLFALVFEGSRETAAGER
jgi:hypothetical protein